MGLYSEENGFQNTARAALIFCILFTAAALLVALLLPAHKHASFRSVVAQQENSSTEVSADFGSFLDDVSYTGKHETKGDEGLSLYRQPSSRAAVEWFYLHVTGDRDVSMAILESANKNDIPLSLAFALAYTESRYDRLAVNRNTNASIDRGLFQLNNASFPQLSENEFFDPAVSAKYGMSHLRFCLNVAGNEISALAMYNAGTSKVRTNSTPQRTLDYIGKIMGYQEMIERLFSDEVLSYYDNAPLNEGIPVAFYKK